MWRGTKTSGRNAIDRAKGGVEELRPQCVRGAPYYCFYFIFYFQLPDPTVVPVFLVFVQLGHIIAYWVGTFLAPMNHEARQLQLINPTALPLRSTSSTSALYAPVTTTTTHTRG